MATGDSRNAAKALTVLLVEDSVEDAELIERALSRRDGERYAITLLRVDTEETLARALADEATAWDIVISDWSMPQLSAMKALKLVEESARDLPFIILTGMIGETNAVDAIRAGVRDYVSKNDLSRLWLVVERELRARDAREQQRKQERDRRVTQAASAERKRVLALSGDIGLALAEARTLSETLRPCVESLIEHTGAVLARIWTLDEAGKMLELQASAGIAQSSISSNNAAAPLSRISIDEMPAARELRVTASPVFVGLPLFVDDKVVGVMEVFGTDQPFSAVMVKSLAAISDTIAVGIRRKSVELANQGLEQQLRQAQKMEAVGRLAGGVAHDFNNLLSVILSYADLLLEDINERDPKHADVDEIKRAGLRAAELTKQLLMFSRQQVLEPKVLDLNDVIANTKKMLTRIVGEDIVVALQGDPDLARVRMDLGSIEQVIMNLVVNARDAMPQGGRIAIETSNVVASKGATPTVMLAISDTGQGMDSETQARIFEPFFTTKARGKGTGLGLSTVFGIVEQSGGKISIESEVGKGTTFRIHLPALPASVAADSGPMPIPIPTTLRGSESVLLVEDEDQVRVVVRGILRRHGYEVIEAQNAGEALLVTETSQKIDLLLTDVVMPRMSGPELAKRLLKVRPELKVICMSGYTNIDFNTSPEQWEGIAYLQKPITPQSLAIKLREVLDA